MSQTSTNQWDLRLARICLTCPVCRRARANQQGTAYQLVKQVESRFCPFCRAYKRVYGRWPHERLNA